MPIIKSAIKKLRQDKKRSKRNAISESLYKKALGDLKKGKLKDLKKVYSQVDKAAKKGIIHKKKASRIKSLTSRLISSKKKTAK